MIGDPRMIRQQNALFTVRQFLLKSKLPRERVLADTWGSCPLGQVFWKCCVFLNEYVGLIA
jgi:hypothetical protein